MIEKIKYRNISLEVHIDFDWDGDPYIEHLYSDGDIADLITEDQAEEIENLAKQSNQDI